MSNAEQLKKLATATRNDALEFAMRTLKNLEFLDQAREHHADVHIVTHLTNSLLGLLVFTVEKEFVHFILKEQLADLEEQGWPHWTFELDSSETLGDLVYHLRNAVAHGRVWFSSDSREMSDVNIRFEDAKPQTKRVYWKSSIPASDLKAFCTAYAGLLENVIG